MTEQIGALTIRQARQALGNLSQEGIYKLLALENPDERQLASFTIGRKRYISRQALANFIERREAIEAERRPERQ